MSLASIIALVSTVNADPSARADHEEPADPQEQARPIHNPTPMKGMTLPEKGTLDARGFILAVRKAKDRQETIQAIAAYCGYRLNGDFGSQDQAARAQAQRELRGERPLGPSRQEQRQANRSAVGFVAGMPKPAQRILLNLQARERAAAAAMLDAKTEAEKEQYRSLLGQIQTAINEMVG